MARRIRALKVTAAYHQLPIGLTVNIINGLILVVILWGAIDGGRLLTWLLLLYGVTLLRFAMLRRYQGARASGTESAAFWRLAFIAGALGSGLAWGAAALLLFHPDSLSHQIFLAFALGGMVAGGLPLLSILPPAFPCFLIPVSLPIIGQLALEGGRLPITMAHPCPDLHHRDAGLLGPIQPNLSGVDRTAAATRARPSRKNSGRRCWRGSTPSPASPIDATSTRRWTASGNVGREPKPTWR